MNNAMINKAAAYIADAINKENESRFAFLNAAKVYYKAGYRCRDLAATANSNPEFIAIVERAIHLALGEGGRLALLPMSRKEVRSLDDESKRLRGKAKSDCGTYRIRIQKYLSDLESPAGEIDYLTGEKKSEPESPAGDSIPEDSIPESANSWQKMNAAAAAFYEAVKAIDRGDIPQGIKFDSEKGTKAIAIAFKALGII